MQKKQIRTETYSRNYTGKAAEEFAIIEETRLKKLSQESNNSHSNGSI
jgi:hypothetical protein